MQRTRRALRLLASFAALAAILACGGGDHYLTQQDDEAPQPPQVAQTPTATDPALAPNQEPPLELRIEHAGGVAFGVMGAPIALGTEDGAPRVTVYPQPHRTFPHGALHFSYPANFVFEAENDPDLDEWSLSGTHFEIMIFRYPGVTPPSQIVQTYVTGIRAQFGTGTTESPITIRLGQTSHNGTRLTLRVASQLLTQDAIAFNHRGNTYLFVLQDGQPEAPYREMTEARELLSSTFELR
ncbi:MAG: hypothetical protein AB7S26_24465 [Sandaracinaceae bacterium]